MDSMGEGPFPTGRMEHLRDGGGKGHLHFGSDRILFIGRRLPPSAAPGLNSVPLTLGCRVSRGALGAST